MRISNFILIGLTGVFFSCAGSKVDDEISLKEKFSSGLENLEKEKYLQAQSDFKYVVVRGTGSDLGDDAQYYLGEAFYLNEEYLLAIAEYEKLTRRMAFSPFVEDARFKICEAYSIESPKYYHDQEYTEKALQRYQEFLDDFPSSELVADAVISIELLREKLAIKLFEAGILYMKMDEYESAKLTYQKVIDLYYDTDVIHKAYFEMVKALAKNENIDEAISLLDQDQDILVENELYNDANSLIQQIQKSLDKVK